MLLLWLVAPSAQASQEGDFGLGGITSGRVGSVTATVENPFAAIYNPALLSESSDGGFAFSVSAASAHYSGLGSVLVDSSVYRTEGLGNLVGNGQVPDENFTFWAVGFTYPFELPFLPNRSIGIGAVVSGPFGKFASFDAGSPYDFSTLHYGVGDEQLKATFGLAMEIVPGWLSAGAGVTLYTASSGAGDATITTDNPTGRVALDVGLNSALIAGLYAKLEPRTSLGLVFHQSLQSTFQQVFDGRVQWAGTEPLHQNFVMTSTLYSEPASVEADLQHDFGVLVASAGVAYEKWSDFQASFLGVSTTNASGVPLQTQIPNIPRHDTLNPRASISVPLFHNRVEISTGYEYRPTPLGDLSGPANLLDSNTHIVGLSLEHRFNWDLFSPSTVRWGIYGQYHWITSRTITKSDPNFIGSPDYPFSGVAYTYGISLSADL